MSRKTWARHYSTVTGATETDSMSGKDKPIRHILKGLGANQRTTWKGFGQSEASVCSYNTKSKPSEKWNWISFQGKGNEDVWPDKWTFGLKNALQLHALLKLLTILFKRNILLSLILSFR